MCQVVRLLSRMMSQRSEVRLGGQQQCQCSSEVKVPPHSHQGLCFSAHQFVPCPVSDGPDRGPGLPPTVVGPVGSSTAHEPTRWGALLWPGGCGLCSPGLLMVLVSCRRGCAGALVAPPCCGAAQRGSAAAALAAAAPPQLLRELQAAAAHVRPGGSCRSGRPEKNSWAQRE